MSGRLKRFDTLARGIERKLSRFVHGLDEVVLRDLAEHPRVRILLRLALLWSFSDQLLVSESPQLESKGSLKNKGIEVRLTG